jgi:hypothetical protein
MGFPVPRAGVKVVTKGESRAGLEAAQLVVADRFEGEADQPDGRAVPGALRRPRVPRVLGLAVAARVQVDGEPHAPHHGQR